MLGAQICPIIVFKFIGNRIIPLTKKLCSKRLLQKIVIILKYIIGINYFFTNFSCLITITNYQIHTNSLFFKNKFVAFYLRKFAKIYDFSINFHEKYVFFYCFFVIFYKNFISYIDFVYKKWD